MYTWEILALLLTPLLQQNTSSIGQATAVSYLFLAIDGYLGYLVFTNGHKALSILRSGETAEPVATYADDYFFPPFLYWYDVVEARDGKTVFTLMEKFSA